MNIEINDENFGKPEFNRIKADQLIGKYILIGLSYLDKDGNLIEQKQKHGIVESADDKKGFKVALKGLEEGNHFLLPPDTDAIHAARLGEYSLRSTGEKILNPDYTCSWNINSE